MFFFGSFVLYFVVLGLQEGRKQGRKQQIGRIGSKEGRRDGGRAGRKEGTVFVFASALETLAATVVVLSLEPKPYCPKALNHLMP